MPTFSFFSSFYCQTTEEQSDSVHGRTNSRYVRKNSWMTVKGADGALSSYVGHFCGYSKEISLKSKDGSLPEKSANT